MCGYSISHFVVSGGGEHDIVVCLDHPSLVSQQVQQLRIDTGVRRRGIGSCFQQLNVCLGGPLVFLGKAGFVVRGAHERALLDQHAVVLHAWHHIVEGLGGHSHSAPELLLGRPCPEGELPVVIAQELACPCDGCGPAGARVHPYARPGRPGSHDRYQPLFSHRSERCPGRRRLEVRPVDD